MNVALREVLFGSGIDGAWAAAEDALPDGWRIGELKYTGYRGAGERWLVMAWEFADDMDYRTFKSAYGNSPIEALDALTAQCQATP